MSRATLARARHGVRLEVLRRLRPGGRSGNTHSGRDGGGSRNRGRRGAQEAAATELGAFLEVSHAGVPLLFCWISDSDRVVAAPRSGSRPGPGRRRTSPSARPRDGTPSRRLGSPSRTEARVLGGKVVHDDGDVAVAISQRGGFRAIVVDGQLQLETVAGRSQIDQGEPVEGPGPLPPCRMPGGRTRPSGPPSAHGSCNGWVWPFSASPSTSR